MGCEIERKWVVDRPFIPWKMIDDYEEDLEHQTQWYIGGARYRRGETYHGWVSYIKTIKTGEGINREEIETEMDECEFWEIVNSQDTHPVRKTRYSIPHGDVTIELDLMLDFKCVYAEIEFKSVEQALAFDDIPYWFKEEVTNNQEHTMYSYFIRTNR